MLKPWLCLTAEWKLAYSSTFRVLAFSFLVGALSLGGIASAVSQDDRAQNDLTEQAPAPVSSVVQQQKPVINDLKQQAQKIGDQLPKAASSDEALANLKLQLDTLSRKILDAGVSFRPRLTEVNTRLEQLGPAPSGDQPPEPTIVADERARLAAERP